MSDDELIPAEIEGIKTDVIETGQPLVSREIEQTYEDLTSKQALLDGLRKRDRWILGAGSVLISLVILLMAAGYLNFLDHQFTQTEWAVLALSLLVVLFGACIGALEKKYPSSRTSQY